MYLNINVNPNYKIIKIVNKKKKNTHGSWTINIEYYSCEINSRSQLWTLANKKWKYLFKENNRK